MMAQGGGIAHPTAMIRRDVLVKAGGYRAQYEHSEDLDLWLRLAEQGRLANLPQALFKYRRHVQSICGSRHAEQIRLNKELLREAYKRRGLSIVRLPVAPGQQRDFSAADQHRVMAWLALRARNVRTARKHALITLRRAPFSLSSWRVLACAIRGH